MMLPISTGIFARDDTAAAPVAIYGTLVTLIATAHLALWIDVHRRVAVWSAVVPAALGVILLGCGLVIGLFHPWIAQYFWYLALTVRSPTGPVHQAVLRLRGRDEPQ